MKHPRYIHVRLQSKTPKTATTLHGTRRDTRTDFHFSLASGKKGPVSRSRITSLITQNNSQSFPAKCIRLFNSNII